MSGKPFFVEIHKKNCPPAQNFGEKLKHTVKDFLFFF